ncbi:MAG: hypothetical protein JW798_00835 [Prolixibacteraceae bacterium]|nr:hypothetical protein [Prolixibacteraceae bacterium]
MIFDINYMIEKYILGRLRGKELHEFQSKIKQSPGLAKKIKYNRELIDSVLEKDVMELRSTLNTIVSKQKRDQKQSNLFDLAKNIDPGSISSQLPDGEKTKGANPLQDIHIKNHIKSLSERIHLIDKQNKPQETVNTNHNSDSNLWDNIEQAIKENDIIELRNNLKHILSESSIDISDFEIDSYLTGDMLQKDIKRIEELILSNKHAKNQLRLHKEIDEAIAEKDIHSLRASISDIFNEEQQPGIEEIKRVDDYLLDYLDEKERLEFETQLSEDDRLKTEIIFNEEINEAIIEKDILRLRASLKEITSENNSETKIRRLIPDSRNKHLRYIGAAASITAIVSAGVYSLQKQNQSVSQLYQQVYKPYNSVGLYRSATSSDHALKGIEQYNQKNFENALKHFSIILAQNNQHPVGNYYSGLCHLELQQYNKAIQSFQGVIAENNNLFIEQAEWYMALGYLANNEEKKAYTTLYAIIEKKGYYKKEAKELLKKLKN